MDISECTHSDLTESDLEIFSAPERIQPRGCLLSFSTDGLALLRHSENAAQFLSNPAIRIGASLENCLGAAALKSVFTAREESRQLGRPALLFEFPLPGGIPRDVAVHLSGDELVVECEPVGKPGENGRRIAQLRMVIDQLRDKTDLHSLFTAVVRQIRDVSGYDRVMLYRFDQTGMPQVVAEDKREDLGSFEGHYLATEDVTILTASQYRRTRVRMIDDVIVPQVPLVSAPGLPPLDMSFAQLRGVSPQAKAYFVSRGVRSSTAISLIVDGTLWGMIACRHYTPRVMTIDERAIVKMIGEFASLQIAALIRSHRLEVTTRAQALIGHFLHNAASKLDIPSYVRSQLSSLMPLVECDDIAAWIGGEWTQHKNILPENIITTLVAEAGAKAGTTIWTTDRLSADRISGTSDSDTTFSGSTASGTGAALRSLLPGIAGLMIIPVSPTPGDYMFVFRREVIRIINRPGTSSPSAPDAGNGHIPPRLTRLRGRSDPWTIEDEEAAEQLRSALIEVMGAYRQQQILERAEADTRQRMLNEELSHRVKNILAVVQSLISRPLPPGRSAEEHLTALRGRIAALATAHDQISRAAHGGSLRALLEAELAPYRLQAGTVTLEGPDLWLPGKALSIMTLLFHELATNAAKYGALSVREGRLTVSWAQNAQAKTWDISWTETNGPAVKPAARSGFGSVLLERAVSHELGGRASRDLRPEGAIIRVSIPDRFGTLACPAEMSARQQTKTEPTSFPAEKTGHSSSDGVTDARILLVEDQLLIAMEVEDALRDFGAAEVTTVSSVEEGVSIVETRLPDVAILDVNLDGKTSVDLARLLRRKGVPFVFATGYMDRSMIPDEFQTIPVIRKPYAASAIASALGALLDTRRSAA
ncbi:GAF domain-containing protein [Acetobacter musti]|uniref:histidine kinase n=1 Tax=Acetobacter musti TaxID=864732 RepID=A0ABX0JN03_9PROT|nr:HWE histidine kinase domain-containing protein [Acetobacter musti]NHN84375.1 GAF domain-containing protein [Acetobacter musti]